MKRLLFIVALLGALMLGGCQAANPPQAAASPSQSAGPSEAAPPETSGTGASQGMAAPSLPPQFTATFDDQKQVEQLIKDYFAALEKKDYDAAWKLTSAQRQEDYPEEQTLKEHWGIESVELVSMKGYLPPYIAALFPPYEFHATDVPEGVPTIWFEVEFDITPSPNTAWESGVNHRFVDVVKDPDGTWKIDGLATGL
ncbi:protein of unknown function [Sporobacter termitidis DSM 10068]|uniref:DUF4829 domain-containing protein n=1 Tax=Sporobacter termitidis DSM 10068 TaxID=1123282 RepID=A0A1M5UP21_9FIRM|nr:DUF4829 domain-containing protein [Sporobacter termitidis]SHH64715.1 protein of unknown function [Sporobacter termitidis DSM 10068]